MNIQSLKCPECGATLDIKPDMEFCFCMYCGCKIHISDEYKRTYRYINDAEVKRAETEHIVRLKELELEEKDRANKKFLVIVWLVSTAVLCVLGIIGWTIDVESLGMCLLLAMCVGLWGGVALFELGDKKKKARRVVGPNDVIITKNMANFQGKHYHTVRMLYITAGFEHVIDIPLNDLSIFTGAKRGKVTSVSIGGNDSVGEGDVFSKTDLVQIVYHSLP